jgi:uncharacterized protein (TIGR03083 family)
VHEGRRYIDMLAREWAVLDELCSGFTDTQWVIPTELPAWSVKDVLSHIVGTEAFLLGRGAEHEIEPRPYVHNPLGELNEREVDFRRTRSGTAVLDEFRIVTAERLEVVRALSDDELDQITWTPIGMNPVAVFIAVRVFDCWIHEQDIRRVVDIPGHLSGDIAQHAYAILRRGLPKAVAKGAGAPDGSSVVFEVEDLDSQATTVVGVEAGRGHMLDIDPEGASTRLSMDLETFVCLTCGRWDAAQATQEGSLRIEGDTNLGATVAANLNGML